jgi:predicted nucleotide-binding protein
MVRECQPARARNVAKVTPQALQSKAWQTAKPAGFGETVDTLDPSLFIGSSSEGLPIARALQTELDQVCEPVVWSQGAFGPTETTIGSLLEMAQSSDFAALVLTPDDPVVIRGAEVIAARDNVVFELGLFLGTLGPRRVFIIRPRDLNLTLPSDLAGVTLLDYRNRSDQNLQAAIGPAATRIRDRISSEGPRSERGLMQPDQEAARFWLKYGGKVPEVKDAARRLLARLPERTGRTLERLSASLDKDLMVSSFGYIARDAGGAEYPERAVLMARRSWVGRKGPTRLGIGLGQSVNPDPHSELRRPFWGIYAADPEILDRLRESFGPSDALWHPWAQWEYLRLDPPDGRRDLLTHFATAVAEHARLSWEENIRILDRVIDRDPF